jgi:hypothetical protein
MALTYLLPQEPLQQLELYGSDLAGLAGSAKLSQRSA